MAISGYINKVSSTQTSITFTWYITTDASGFAEVYVNGAGQNFYEGYGVGNVITGTGTASGLSPGTSYMFNTGGIDSNNDTGLITQYYSTDAAPLNPPSWTDNTLGGFQATIAYSDGVSATNSPTYSVSSGSLPSGISLNTGNGAVTGTPTTAGSYSFTLRASNSDGVIDQSFSGSVAAAPTFPPAWSDNTLAAFIVGLTYSDQVVATNMTSYSGAYSVSSGALPAGISLNTSTGAVTGTPTSPASYSFVLTATNTFGSISQSFTGAAGGGLAVFDGTSWYRGPVKVYDGTTWKLATVKLYNGSSWGASN
jgi:hypothetical protein